MWLENHGWLGWRDQTFTHGYVVPGNQMDSTRPDPSTRLANELEPAEAGGANRVLAEMSTQLWHCRFWLAPTSRVTSVTNVRPRWVRNGAIAGSVRPNVCSA